MKTTAFTIAIAFVFINAYSQSETPKALGEQKTYVYKTVGKTPIRLEFFQTAANTQVKPLIVWIHGGALMGGSRKGLQKEQLDVYLGGGYSVASIDYRLAPETKLPAIIEDLKDAFQWVRDNSSMLKIDANKIFAIGHSAGGYLALMSGYVLKNPPQGIVSFYGYGDIQADWYAKPDSFYRTREHVTKETVMKLIADSIVTYSVSQERGPIYLYSRQNGLWPLMVGGHDPIKEAPWFYQYCPLKNVRSNYPPVLLLHGDKDSDVPFEQSVLMDKELEAKKIKHQFIRLPNYEHGFDRSYGGLSNPTIKQVFDDVLTFLESCK